MIKITKIMLSSAVLTVLGTPTALASGDGSSTFSSSMNRAVLTNTTGTAAKFADNGVSQEKEKTIGFDLIIADQRKDLAIPLSYGLPLQLMGGDEFLNLSADIPFSMVDTGTGSDETGLGDSVLGAEYYVEHNSIILKTAINWKLPTGDQEVGLGSGSNDIAVSFSGRKRQDQIGYNALFAYSLNGEGEAFGVTIDYGNTITISAGGEYNVKPDLWLAADLTYINQDSSSGGLAGLTTIDLIPSASYRFMEDKDVIFRLMIPVTESLVDGLPGQPTPKRDVTFSIGLSSEF